ncbi:MAG: hypothetical protein AAB937_00825 [Patescibacteria group bacterium]
MSVAKVDIEKQHQADHAAYKRALRAFHTINSVASQWVAGSEEALHNAENQIQEAWRRLSWSGDALTPDKAHEHPKPTVHGR